MNRLMSYLIVISVLAACTFRGGTQKSKLETLSDMTRDIEAEWTVPSVSAATALSDWKNNKDVVFVDVREENEYLVSKIPGAITLKTLRSQPDFYKNKTIYVYCTIGHRSGRQTQTLRDLGFQAYNIPGSILLWTHLKGPLVDQKNQSTKNVHVYGERWNLLPDDHSAVLNN
ncbi:MAG: rhodanese-like domain-containing protein [Pseudobacteriovorax sp.]|nr:rhodanese-like domain-containing protein [Pseudobacteriovorax sp.]